MGTTNSKRLTPEQQEAYKIIADDVHKEKKEKAQQNKKQDDIPLLVINKK